MFLYIYCSFYVVIYKSYAVLLSYVYLLYFIFYLILYFLILYIKKKYIKLIEFYILSISLKSQKLYYFREFF